MKRCPTCNRVETDDALAFCRVDGATLVTGPLSDSETTTAHLGTAAPASEQETDILPHHTNEAVARSTGPTTTLPSQRLPSQTRPLTKRRRTKLIVAAGVAIVVAVA